MQTYPNTCIYTYTRIYKRIYIYIVSCILWHIILCRLFNARSILMQIFSTISNNSV